MVVVISGTNGITAPGLTSQDSTGTITLTTSGFATIGGPLTVNDSASITGSLTAGSLSVTGALTAASTSITGSISADSATFTGAVNAGAASITGSISADSATFTGAVNAGAASITGSISADSATISGNLTVDTNTLFVDAANNRVGVGTVSPDGKLHVAGGNMVIDNNQYLVGKNSVGSNSNLIGRASDDTLFVGDSAFANPTVIQTGNNSIRFNANGLERMRIDAGGNVGIGTSSPGEKLAVTGSILINASSAPTWDTNTRHWAESGFGARYDGYQHRFDVGLSRTEALRIDQNGTVYASAAIQEGYTVLSGTTPSIDAATSGAFALTTSGNTTFNFASVASGRSVGFVLRLTAGGSHTITWPASVDWAGGTAPDAPASGETDVLVFYTVDGGTTWYGARAIDAAA